MKVCTDACLFGALAADRNRHAANCLDIGTGTGLLSLMIAQKNNDVKIDAVEIHAAAAEQAFENITASPWAKNIHVHHTDILNFNSGKIYEHIIANPPFFEDDLQSPDAAKNNAKHDTSLNLAQLLDLVAYNLNKDGVFSVLLPYHRVDHFIEEAIKAGLYLNSQVLVKQTVNHDFFRGILFFTKKEIIPQLSELIIKDSTHNYTPEFTAALKDYYLFL